jgi:hypothetical protein
MSTYAYHNILNKIRQELTPEEQIQLLADLAASVRDFQIAQKSQQGRFTPSAVTEQDSQAAQEPEHTFLELRGLGKELWRSVDVDQYLEEERNSWDG